MPETCDWCGEPTDEIALELSNLDDRYLSMNIEELLEMGQLDVCKDCTSRLAGKMHRLKHLLGLHPKENEQELARQMILMADFVNSEPPRRDWEDTHPIGSSSAPLSSAETPTR